jgi:hypothetical protein
MDFVLEFFQEYFTYLLGGIGGVIIAISTAFFKTQFFVDLMDKRILLGKPEQIASDDIKLINDFLNNDEIKVISVIHKLPKLSFTPFTNPEHLHSLKIEPSNAEQHHDRLVSAQLPDDPHAYVLDSDRDSWNNLDFSKELNAYVVDRYSTLLAVDDKTKKDLLIIGANNLVINPYKSEFILHKRSSKSETQSGKLHGFGGGYLPYWENGKKSLTTRRDDRKDLRCTAMRELHEESGLLSLKHIPDTCCVIEERHSQDEKFGYLTFFFITLLETLIDEAQGDPNEGVVHQVPISKKNIYDMTTKGELNGLLIHPQLRSMLLLWLFMGCPGIHYIKRRQLRSTRKKVRTHLIG